uniref:Polyamine aminopropyltransferase n=1 Tax=Candidatus Kentrum sp. MB TaxID=2138164 RepID=A0A450XSJ5_9GAMM|nr:MAG: spermidine synthase [Candidatus Kentron sp. MB]VFK35231.1 MAG: spermidine synthase [Candidatus Kentron sp. MB]VFK77209.1 MAG: spermidine synthase [Candidatus Kentron sp. MB]
MSELVRSDFGANLWNMWFTELNKEGAGLTLKVKRVIHSSVSDFQRIDVLETEEFGKALVLYGSIMITEKDEFTYHEMISHVPLSVHPAPSRVLIIGGGDGGALREALRHQPVQTVQVVEIDAQVVQVCKRFFPGMTTGFDNPRAQLIYDDGARFIANTREQFDLVISDSSDPLGPAEVLFKQSFYQNVHDRLAQDGIFVAQTESPLFHADNVRNIYKNLRAVFPIVKMYLAHIPTYPSALWSFAFCSKRYHPLRDFRPETADGITGLHYYNADIHHGAFALPNYVKALLPSLSG